jgi:hypothetical protein
MIKTGVLLAQQIDAAAEMRVNNYKKSHLTNIINEGTQHIAECCITFLLRKQELERRIGADGTMIMVH